MKSYRRSRGIALLIINLGVRWRWVVKITLRPLYRRKERRYPFTEGWVGLRADLDVLREEINLLFLPGLKPGTVQPVAWSLYRLIFSSLSFFTSDVGFRYNVFCIVTILGALRSRHLGSFSRRKFLRRLWCPPASNWCRVLCTRSKAAGARGWQLHLVPSWHRQGNV
jgi:hypothetical protein